MQITRRRLMVLAAAGAAAPLLPRLAWAQTTLEWDGLRLDTLSDGHLVLPGSFAFGSMPADTIAPILARHGIEADQVTPPCNVTLLRAEGITALIDAGAGEGFMPTAGRLPEALAALEVAPEAVTHVIFTHGHPDHLWGVLDDFDDPRFPNARHLMGAAEAAYWRDPETAQRIGPERQAFAAGAARRLEILDDRLETFEDGETLLPGLTALATPGHTPGHMSFELAGSGERLVILGDAIPNHHTAFEAPQLHQPSDHDPEQAARTRVLLLERLSAEALPMVGFHLPDGGLARAEAQADGYRHRSGGR